MYKYSSECDINICIASTARHQDTSNGEKLTLGHSVLGAVAELDMAVLPAGEMSS
jgi:hypothetical protein